MKNLRLLVYSALLLLGFTANAQNETVALKTKKLQQLYLSIGTGPAATSDQESNVFGGTYQLNLTGAFGSNSVCRLNFQHSVFTNTNFKSPGVFSYLGGNDYYTNFSRDNESMTISFSYGKKKKLNKLVQVQALGGIGFNLISKLGRSFSNNAVFPEYVIESCIPETYYKPGLLLQADVVFLPSKFAGLTAGAYANLTPKLPSAGINLSLNLGMLK